MALRDVLLDTNAYVAFKRGAPDAVEVFTHVPRTGINSIVLGELLSGFAVGTREEANRQELQQFLTSERVHQMVIDAETAARPRAVSPMICVPSSLQRTCIRHRSRRGLKRQRHRRQCPP